MKAIIIENEKAASDLLCKILHNYCTDISVEGIGVSISEGLKLLNNIKPDLVFLDIELDDGKSFELLDMIEKKDFQVIFTTAYDQYALKAFRYDAVDYILKPYTPKSVLTSVNRVVERKNNHRVFEKLNQVLDKNVGNRISFSTSKGIRICNSEDILKLEADGSYCKVYLTSGEMILVSKPLSDIEFMLPDKQFFRVHLSHTVNISLVKNVLNSDGGYIEMNDGSQVPLARRRKQEFIELLKQSNYHV